jgi:hypothetical protein
LPCPHRIPFSTPNTTLRTDRLDSVAFARRLDCNIPLKMNY